MTLIETQEEVAGHLDDIKRYFKSGAKITILVRFDANLLKEKVFRLIKEKSFVHGEYTLASGKKSDYYLDMKPTMFDAEGANALAEMILDAICDLKVESWPKSPKINSRPARSAEAGHTMNASERQGTLA